MSEEYNPTAVLKPTEGLFIASNGRRYSKAELRQKFALPQPPFWSKCPRCDSRMFMHRNRTKRGNRIYVCAKCMGNFESPVSYFECSLFSPEHGPIEEDTEVRICQDRCPVWRFLDSRHERACPFYMGMIKGDKVSDRKWLQRGSKQVVKFRLDEILAQAQKEVGEEYKPLERRL